MKRSQIGQGMTEYIIIVALIAVAAIGVYSFFGKSVRNQVSAISTEISGVDSGEQISAAKSAAEQSSSVANRDYNLGNYNEGANKASGGGTGGGGNSSDPVD